MTFMDTDNTEENKTFYSYLEKYYIDFEKQYFATDVRHRRENKGGQDLKYDAASVVTDLICILINLTSLLAYD